MLKVLIIDDDKMSCRDIEAALREIYNRNEIYVYNALNYGQTQKIIYSHKIDIDLLIIDLVLDKSDIVDDGIDIIKEILMYRNDLPFIIVSGYYFERVKDTNRQLLGHDQYIGFLDKGDYTDDDILDVLDKAYNFIEKKRSESVSQKITEKDRPEIPIEEILKYLARDCEFHKKAIEDLKLLYKKDKKLYHSVLDFIGNYDRNPHRFKSEMFSSTQNKIREVKNTVRGEAMRLFVIPRSPKSMICRICPHPSGSNYTVIKKWLQSHF